MKVLAVFHVTIIMENRINTAGKSAGKMTITEYRNMIFEGVPGITAGAIMSMEESMGGRILDEAKTKKMEDNVKYVKATVINVIELGEDVLKGAEIMN